MAASDPKPVIECADTDDRKLPIFHERHPMACVRGAASSKSTGYPLQEGRILQYSLSVRILLSLIVLLQFAAASVAEEAVDLHAELAAVMSSMNQLWKRLDYDDPRDPNVSSQVCPLVSEQNLESMHKSQQFDLEHSTLPDGNVYMGVPGGAQMWQLRGEVLGYSREVLTIYLAPEFCLADYSHLN